jgi:hypothetical protein
LAVIFVLIEARLCRLNADIVLFVFYRGLFINVVLRIIISPFRMVLQRIKAVKNLKLTEL